jgi:hypothetical protein
MESIVIYATERSSSINVINSNVVGRVICHVCCPVQMSVLFGGNEMLETEYRNGRSTEIVGIYSNVIKYQSIWK